MDCGVSGARLHDTSGRVLPAVVRLHEVRSPFGDENLTDLTEYEEAEPWMNLLGEDEQIVHIMKGSSYLVADEGLTAVSTERAKHCLKTMSHGQLLAWCKVEGATVAVKGSRVPVEILDNTAEMEGMVYGGQDIPVHGNQLGNHL